MLQMMMCEYISIATAKIGFNVHAHAIQSCKSIFKSFLLLIINWIVVVKTANINLKRRSSGEPHTHKSFTDFYAFYVMHENFMDFLCAFATLCFYEYPYKCGPDNRLFIYIYIFLLSAFTIIVHALKAEYNYSYNCFKWSLSATDLRTKASLNQKVCIVCTLPFRRRKHLNTQTN